MFDFIRTNPVSAEAVGVKWDALYDILRAGNALAVVFLSLSALNYITTFYENGDTTPAPLNFIFLLLAVALLVVSSVLLPVIIRTEKLFDTAEVTGANEAMVSRISRLDMLLFILLNAAAGFSVIAVLFVLFTGASVVVMALLVLTGLSFVAASFLSGRRSSLTERYPVEAAAYRQRAIGHGFRAAIASQGYHAE